MATQTRHPGRRPPASESKEQKHLSKIEKKLEARNDQRTKLDEANDELAKACDDAMNDGVQTNVVAKTLDVSRQMVYKLVRERVDGKPMTSANGSGKATKKSTAKPTAKKGAAKPAAKKDGARPGSKKGTAKPAASKSAPKPGAKKGAAKPAASKSTSGNPLLQRLKR